MNKIVEAACGTKQIKGGSGILGMSAPEIKKLFAVKTGPNAFPGDILKEFRNLRAAGQTRTAMCMLLRTFPKGRALLGITTPTSSPAKSNKNTKGGFQAPGLNIGELVAPGQEWVRPSRAANKDPFNKRLQSVQLPLKGGKPYMKQATVMKLLGVDKSGDFPNLPARLKTLLRKVSNKPPTKPREPTKPKPRKYLNFARNSTFSNGNNTARKPMRPSKPPKGQKRNRTSMSSGTGPTAQEVVKRMKTRMVAANATLLTKSQQAELNSSKTSKNRKDTLRTMKQNAKKNSRYFRLDKNSKKYIFAVSGGEKVAEKMVKRTRENANRRRGVSGLNAKKHALGIHQKSNNSNGNSNSCNTCNGNSNSNGSVKSNGNWSNSNTENSPNAKAKAKARAKTNAKANANFKNARAKATAKASVNSPVFAGWTSEPQKRPTKRPSRKAPNNVISNASAKQFEDMMAQFGDLATQ